MDARAAVPHADPMSDHITRDELLELIDGNAVVVVESLPAPYYESGHLPGAINIPHTEVRERAAALLPDKDAAIVTYCANAACPNSAIAQTVLRKLGYTNVRKYAEGKQDWQEAGLPLVVEVPV